MIPALRPPTTVSNVSYIESVPTVFLTTTHHTVKLFDTHPHCLPRPKYLISDPRHTTPHCPPKLTKETHDNLFIVPHDEYIPRPLKKL